MRNLTIEEMELVSGAGGGSSSGDVNVLNDNKILNDFLNDNKVKVQILDDLIDVLSSSSCS